MNTQKTIWHRPWHRRAFAYGSGCAAAATVLVCARDVRAAFSQVTCSPTTYATIEADLGAYEFDRMINGTDYHHYSKNENFSWKLFVNTNLLQLQPHLLNWNSEPGFDYLSFNNSHISGQLGTTWYNTTFLPTRDQSTSAWYYMQWVSDYSVVVPSWPDAGDGTPGFVPRVDQLRGICLPSSQQTSTAPIRYLNPNTRYDAAFFHPSDVMYFFVSQPANRDMAITVDLNYANATGNGFSTLTDFDVYASASTSRPDNTNASWRDTGYALGPTASPNRAGAYVLVPNSTTTRQVYFAVRNVNGTGHVSVRANVLDRRSLTICTQDRGVTAAQIMASSHWPHVELVLRRTLARVFLATNGNLQFTNIIVKQMANLPPTGDGSEFCTEDSTCDWCMRPGPNADGMQAVNGRVRIPNYQNWTYDPPDDQRPWLSQVLSHEAGHGLLRMATHQDQGLLQDQYGPPRYTSPLDHSVMNCDFSYKYSTDFNHCKADDPTPPPLNCDPKSDWGNIIGTGLFGHWVLPDQMQSSQPWIRYSDNYWALYRSMSFTAK